MHLQYDPQDLIEIAVNFDPWFLPMYYKLLPSWIQCISEDIWSCYQKYDNSLQVTHRKHSEVNQKGFQSNCQGCYVLWDSEYH